MRLAGIFMSILRAKGSSQQSVLDVTWAHDLASKSALLSLPLRGEYGL
jgi:hypothetical protein